MRDKFSELIKQGIAKFDYTPITQSIPEQDPICRLYNNIFSIPSDTHMSCLDDGTRVITGHMINTNNWEKFMCMPYWGAVNFRTSGFNSVCDFLYKNRLKCEIGELNGDVVCMVKDMEEMQQPTMSATYHTNESKIPQPITQLITDRKIEHIKECFNSEDPIKSLNESPYILGESWINYNGKVMGLICDKVIFMG